MSGYAALWCKSNFSFLEGASHPDELVEEAHEQGLDAIAVTDRDGVPGIVRAHVKAKELGLALVVGSEVTVDDGSSIVLLARDRAGYANLCQLVTAGRLRHAKGTCRVRWGEVCERAAGLTALLREPLVRDVEPRDVLDALKSAFGPQLYALLARHRDAEEIAGEVRLRHRAARLDLPLVAATEVLYHRPDRRRVQDVLTAIRHGVPLSRAGRLLKPNSEHALKSRAAFAQLFHDEPRAVARSIEVARTCAFRMSDLRYRYPLEKLPDGADATQWLRTLVQRGAEDRYRHRGGVPLNVREQLDKELVVIEALDYGGYFLTMHEIVQYCRRERILCQGRGSAANSAVCYCLGVTAVDPIEMGLLFERFLSMERAEPPDIDLDIEHERREEVIQHVYARYGRTHAAMVANVIRYRARSAVRDVGKALGFSESDLLRARELSSSWDGPDASSLEQAGFDGRARPTQLLLEIASEIEDFPRHLSIHPGGFLLGHEPIATLVPIENGSMPDRTVIQWDKNDVEALGLFKVDLLALGALTHLRKTFALLHARGVELSMATIPRDDPATYAQVCTGDTVGVFQIESRAQMQMLPRLRPRNYYDLVIEISIVRPGPITGGMVHPYLRRRTGEEPVTYPHPSLEPVLAKTLGVPLFQEQVMRLAVVAADYTPGEADQLRRDMAAWRKAGRIEHHHERIVSRMKAKGIAAEFAERVFEQIRGFGEYGFPESHAASFALISYAGAYLRRHHIEEFTCGLLNSLPMGFYSAATIVDDAKRHGVEFRPVDVAASGWDCSIEERAIRMGLRYVKGLREGDGRGIETLRPFASLHDFQRRARLDAKALEALSSAGAFDSLDEERRTALWKSRGLEDLRVARLFDHEEERAPAFARLDAREEVGWDYASSHHSTRAHPLAAFRSELRAAKLLCAEEVNALAHGERVRCAGLVICRQRPGTASGVTFMTLEDETGFINLVVWLQVFERFALVARSENFLAVAGKIQRDGSVVHVIAEKAWAPRMSTEMTDVGSRDFH